MYSRSSNCVIQSAKRLLHPHLKRSQRKLNGIIFQRGHLTENRSHLNNINLVKRCKKYVTFSQSSDFTTLPFTQSDHYLKMNVDHVEIKLSWLWLRDHCRCESCYNHQTNQKKLVVNTGCTDSTDWLPMNVDLEKGSETLRITWKDGHTTSYDVNWLKENCLGFKKKEKTVPFFWSAGEINKQVLPVVQYKDHMQSEDGLRQSLKNLVKYGFTIVDGVPVSKEETGKVAERITFIQENIFGRVWSMGSGIEREDTAYGNQGIGAHTDTTYITAPSGLQVFHCLKHDGTGGKTLLVDGFNAAQQLRDEHEDDFKYLTQAIVPHEFLDTKHGDHLYSLGHILSCHPQTGELYHIRFNQYDMAPLTTIPQQDVTKFYTAYNKLLERITLPGNELWLKLKPGMVLFIDNWRVLHGRSSFTGNRVLCGCYIGKDEMSSMQRRYGVL